MEIEISRRAKHDLASILSYLELRNPFAANRLSQELKTSILNIGEFPQIGRNRSRLGRGVRSLVIGRHIIFHRIDIARILVRVVDGRMDVEAELRR